MAQLFVSGGESYFGQGAVSCLSDIFKKYKFERIVVVSDAEIVNAGVIQSVVKLLAKNRIIYQVFDKVYHNPTVANVKAGVELATSFNTDAFIAVGGGSVLDAAKAMSLMCANREITDIRKLEGDVNKTKNKAMPLIAIPTNFSSGSEVSSVFMLSDMNNNRKISCKDKNCIPQEVIIDPDFVLSLKARQTALSCASLFALAVESYLSAKAWSVTEYYSLQAVKLILENAKSAVNKNVKAKENLLNAQYFAGLASSNGGLALMHALSNALEVTHDVNHGVSCSLLLIPVLKFNAPSSGSKYKDLAIAMGAKVSDKASPADYRKTFINAVTKFFKELGVPKKLSEVGVKINDGDFMAECVLKDVHTQDNLKEVSKRKVLEIYKGVA